MRRQEIHIPPDTSLCRRDPSSAQQPQTSSLFVIATGWRLANKSNAEHLPKCSNVLPSTLPAIVCAFDVAPWSCERPPEVHLGDAKAGLYSLQVVQKLDGPVVVQKGSRDNISDGAAAAACSLQGSLRRAGGQARVAAHRPSASPHGWRVRCSTPCSRLLKSPLEVEPDWTERSAGGTASPLAESQQTVARLSIAGT